MGRLLLRKHHVIPSVVRKKWTGILSHTFKLRWSTIWTTDITKKESGLLWAIWHRAMAVNEWRGRISANVDQRCLVCTLGKKESVLHRFWECHSAQVVWSWSTNLIDLLCPMSNGLNRQSVSQSSIESLSTPVAAGSPGAPGAQVIAISMWSTYWRTVAHLGKLH